MVADEEGGIGHLLKQNKKIFYSLTSELVNNQINNKVYYLLLVIEALQILAYQCHEVFEYPGWGVEQFRTLTQFLNPEYYLKHTIMMNVIIPISAVVVFVHAFISICCFKQEKENHNVKKNHDIPSNHNKQKIIYMIGHWYTAIFTTVLTTPVFLPSLLVFYCHPESPYHQGRQCYDTYHIFLICLSVINVLWTLIMNVYYSLFYYIFNPFKFRNVFALSTSLFNLLKITIKVVLPAYLIFDETLQYSYLFVVGVAAGILGYTAVSRVLYPYTRYNLTDDKVILHIETISIFISLMFVLQTFFSEEEGFVMAFIAAFIIPFPIANAAFKFILSNKQESILTINEFEKENTSSIEEFVTYLIVELENTQTEEKDKRFLKVIKLHNEECENISCSCHEYLTNLEEEPSNKEILKEQIFRVLIEIIDKILEVNRKAYSLLLLKSYIEFYKLKSTIKAAFIVSKVLDEKISFFEDYLIHAFLYDVTKTYHDTSNIEKYRLFSEHLILFEKETIKLAQSYAEFWQELSEQNSSIKKIINLMKSSRASKEIVHSEFEILHNIYPTNIHVVNLYKELFKEVLIDYDQFMKYNNIYEDNKKEKEISKLMRSDNLIQFNPNEDLIVINTSVNVSNDIFHGGCEIVSVTNNVHKFLGYSSQQLIGKNINRFLPKIYTEFHDEIITNYLNKKDSELKTRELIIFPLNSNGNLIECSMMVKIMPSLEYGVNILSFLLHNDKSHRNLIIYDHRTGLIDSMSEKAEKKLLGKKSKKNSVAIPDHISDVLPVWDYLNEKINSNYEINSKQIELAYTDIHLCRSDGPKEDKFVKVITFELEFHTKLLSTNSMSSNNFEFGFQTLVENAPNQKGFFKEGLYVKENEEKKTIFEENVNPIIKKMVKNMELVEETEEKMYKRLKKWYPKVYLIIQGLLVTCLLGLIIWNYASTLSYYETLNNDILIKESIVDCGDFVMESAHIASQYVFSHGDNVIFSQVNVQNATNQLTQLQSTGQFVYQEIINKYQLGEFVISDMILNVTYYTSTINIIKQQTVTDASYQFVLYLMEVYNNNDPLHNLLNNIQFVFRNCLNISDEFSDLNEIFTSNLLKNSQVRQSFIISMFVAIMTLFCVGMIWELIYKLIIASKVNDVINVFECVPTSELEKFPLKCENFIKFVSPIEKNEGKINSKSFGLTKSSKKVEKLKEANEESYEAVEEEEEIEYISFSSNISAKSMIFQAIFFIIGFSILFVVHISWESSVLQINFSEVSEWNRISNFKSEIIEIIYVMNEYQNRAQQWTSNELLALKGRFNDSTTVIELSIKETKSLDSYLSEIFELLEQSVFILNSNNITSSEFILNEQKLNSLIEIVSEEQIHTNIEPNIATTINSFLSILQLIFIMELIIFLLFSILYLPKSYKNYKEKNEIAQLMYETLGHKLQSLAETHSKIK